jgi:hypothetical protein
VASQVRARFCGFFAFMRLDVDDLHASASGSLTEFDVKWIRIERVG